jgi:hypothetical protein
VAQAWAYWDGVELFNSLRTTEYIRNGLAGGRVTAQQCACDESLSVNPDGDVETYVSPAADPAPWYDPDDPASGEFLGFLVQIGGLGATLSRTAHPRSSGRGGASLSRLRPKERTLTVTGHLVAATSRGQDYGMRWLASRLSTSLSCDFCDLATMEVQLAEPAEGQDPSEVRWTLRDVGVLEGPTYQDEGQQSCTELRAFDLTLVSEHPYLYKLGEVCLPPQGFPLPAVPCMDFCDWWQTEYSLCCDMAPTPLIDDLAAVIEVYAGFRPVSLDVTTRSGACSGAGSAVAARIPVVGLPAGSTLTIDSSTSRITVVRPDGVAEDGFKYVLLGEETPFDWMALRCGDPSCVCIEARACGVNEDTIVEISLVRRRL